ncbi:MAG: cbb3-type cytochrome oxidase assembly protein CcoS, partial [Cycloclasticus sp.]|nr:cbb3-type cytochrome oxidase assembly protein CcoS [Cycloclasticus sp.]
YFLIPVSIILVAIVIALFLWAVRSGQFDDLDGPAHNILYEEEELLNDVEDKDEGEVNKKPDELV